MGIIDSALAQFGNIGNALGIQGDNPAGYNGLQRMEVQDPRVQAQGLAALANNKDFKAADPATRQAMIQQVAPSAAQAQIANQAKIAASTPTDNLNNMVDYSIKNNTMTPEQGANIKMNPLSTLGSSQSAPAQPNGQQPNAQPQQQTSALQATSPDDKRDWNFLNTQVPAPLRGVVLGLSEGDEQAGNVARSSPLAMQINGWAQQFDKTLLNPGSGFAARLKTSQEFTPVGPAGKTIVAANAGTQHLAGLAVAAYDQHNSGFPLANSVAVPLRQHVLPSYQGPLDSIFSGNSAGAKFDAYLGTVAPELDKVNSGTGSTTVDGVKQQIASFDKYGKPEDQFGAIGAKVKMLQSKADELGGAFKETMGRSKQIITPENQQILNDLQRLSTLADDKKINSPEAQEIVGRLRKVAAPIPVTAPEQPPAGYPAGMAWKNGQPAQQPIAATSAPIQQQPQTVPAKPPVTPQLAAQIMAWRKAQKGAQ